MLRNRKNECRPARGAPEFVVPVITANSGKISRNSVYDPTTGTLLHTVAVSLKRQKAIRRYLRRMNVKFFLTNRLPKIDYLNLLRLQLRLFFIEIKSDLLSCTKKWMRHG